MQWINEREIEHLFHEQHPLVFVEEQSNEGGCYGCGELLSGPCFTCALCNYHLHRQCAEASFKISNHPLHPQHRSGFFLRERPDFDFDDMYGCALCKEKRDMFFYECKTYPCNFSLDIKCFRLSSSYKLNQESKHDFHQHPLTFIENPMDELKKRFNCTWCHQPLLDSIYFCFHCPSFVFHKKCLDELPCNIQHPSHPIHPLFLESEENSLFCKLCQKQHSGYFYSCSLCTFNIRVECAWPRSVVEDKRHHAFTLFWRQGSFICDACDTEGKYVSYICSTCWVIVHKDCTKLPRIIKFSRHAHCLFHKYFLAKQELTRQDCKICFEQVKVERGSYSCAKPCCNYVVHVNCALEDKDLYDVIEQESQCQELCAATQSSIIRVIEVNEDGEATKIEHSNHEGHCLLLANKMEKETDRKCDGCILPVSTPLYYCSESDCHFCLHKNCAEFPRIKQHWFSKSNATLQPKGAQKCAFCRREWSGFFYEIAEHYDVCLRCTEVPDIIEYCEGHQHLLFFDFKCKERCNGCGSPSGHYGAFRCKKCSFALDFVCLTLPHSALHKCDRHMLYLTYHDDNDYKKHDYCDICEGKRDPSLWYYHCSICDTCAHPNCVLGQSPFLKDGTTWPYSFCPSGHHLIFLKKAEDYPICSCCGRLCREEILKCEESTCNYIIHQKCWLD